MYSDIEQQHRRFRILGTLAAVLLFLAGVAVGSAGLGIFAKYSIRWVLAQPYPFLEIIKHELHRKYDFPEDKVDELENIFLRAKRELEIVNIGRSYETMGIFSRTVQEVRQFIPEQRLGVYDRNMVLLLRKTHESAIREFYTQLDVSPEQMLQINKILVEAFPLDARKEHGTGSVKGVIVKSLPQIITILNDEQIKRLETLGPGLERLEDSYPLPHNE